MKSFIGSKLSKLFGGDAIRSFAGSISFQFINGKSSGRRNHTRKYPAHISHFLVIVFIMSIAIFGLQNVSARDSSSLGDLNNDRVINMLDVVLLAKAFNSSIGTSRYVPSYDLNNDGAINMRDVVIIAENFNKVLSPETATPTSTSTSTPTPTPTSTPTSTPTPSPENNNWVGTWATSVQLTESNNMPPMGLSNNTLRQVFRVSIGGDKIRFKLSNEHGNSAMTVNSVHLAVSAGSGSIKADTDKALTFGGKESVTIAAGKAVFSDTVDFNVTQSTDMAVTIYFGSVPSSLTGHPGSRTTSYIVTGNKVSASNMASATTTEHWYAIAGMDVLKDSSFRTIAALGDSITDGRGSTTNQNNRWTDNLAARLLANPATSKVGMCNHGIGGNAILSGGLGPTATARFDRDILGQSGIRYLILFEGVNDIGSGASANNLINAYKQFITKAHAKNILVYGATITPFNGNSYYSASHEQARQAVNTWLRTSGMCDAVIDFDAAVRNPSDQSKLMSTYDTGDGLHLSPAGYKKMSDSIDLDLFTK